MKLYINEKEIPVIWENNESVHELENDVENKDIIISMSMYSNNEQVGSLGKSYPSNDTQTTTQNGDIVLYNSNQIVVFYNPNTWEYTMLGKMSLAQEEVTDLLSNGDIELKLSNH